MSRIGRKPITIPKGVEVTINGHAVSIKGPQGTLKREFPPEVKIVKDGTHIQCSIEPTREKKIRSMFGLVRALMNNMIVGVSTGFTRELEIVGIGFKAKQEGNKVTFNIGYSHPVVFEAPAGAKLKVEGVNKVIVTGMDKQIVGQVASDIRAIKPPEPYKGTGIRYVNEKVRQKEGKKLAA